ncbi:MAG: biotin/lipoyl-containing protein [Chloroflexota bacterium]
MKYIATIGEHSYEIEINSEREVVVDGNRLPVDFQSVAGQPVYSLIIGGRSYEAYVHLTEDGLDVVLSGRLYHVAVEDERERRLRQASSGAVARSGDYHLRAPMPGLIVAVPVGEGQAVERGADLIILESMKMQNELKAPRDGTVAHVRVRPGDRVDQNQVLIILS